MGEKREQARALNGEAIVLARAFALDLAEPLAREALRVASVHSIKREEARAYRTLARLALARGAYDEAEQLAQYAHSLFERLGSRREAIQVTLDVVKACSERGQHVVADQLIAEVEKDALAHGEGRSEATFHLARAESRLKKGDVPQDELEALEPELELALAIALRSRSRELVWRLHGARGAVLASLQLPDEALRAYTSAMDTLKALHAELPPGLRKTYLQDPDRQALQQAWKSARAAP